MRRALLWAGAAVSVAAAAGMMVAAPGGAPPASAGYPDKADLLKFRDADGAIKPVANAADWEVRRGHILAAMQEVMGPLPARDDTLALDMKVVEEVALAKAVRKKITYVSDKDDRVSAYLFVPIGVKEKAPAVLCLHPTNRQIGKMVVAGLGGRANRAYALELAERGFVTLAPDYPNSGEHPFDVYNRGYASATMKAIRDNMRGVDLLVSLPEVDAGNIGCIGHSLGGHNTLFTGAFETRIKAMVSCCGFDTFLRYKGGSLAGWSHAGYMPRIGSVYGNDGKRMPFDFHEVVGALAPRAFLAVAPDNDDNFFQDGVKEVMASAGKVYALLGAADRLKALYPEAGHDFPNASRGAAYAWLDRRLRPAKREVFTDYKAPTPEQALAAMRPTPGFKVELVAAEPDVVDPVAMAFDEHGRLYVAEMHGYPNGGLGEGEITSGRIRLLSEPDETGRFRKSTVFAEGLAFPTSVTPFDGGVIVGCAPDILFLKDTTGAGKADVRKVLFTGFGRHNIQALLNHLQWGIDNRIHGAGAANGGEIRSPEHADVPAVTLRGRNFRFHPRRLTEFEPASGGGQYALACDDWGHWFTNTNSQHLRQIVLPDHYLRRNPNLAVSAVLTDIPDHGAAAKLYRISPDEAWRVERTTARAGSGDRGRFATTELVASGYVTSTCSTLVYRGGLFPPEYAGNVFCCDPANNVIHRDVLAGQGPVLVAERHDDDVEFLASSDNFFRPTDLTVGPDGALYVSDFCRAVIETPLSLTPELQKKYPLQSFDRGRISRITPVAAPDAGAKPQAAIIPGKMSDEELVAAVAHPNSWVRLTAQRLLVERQVVGAVPGLVNLARDAKLPQGRLHALWTLDGLGALSAGLIAVGLNDAHSGVRAGALRLAERHLAAEPELAGRVVELKDHGSPDVRFQLAFTLGELPAADGLDALVHLMKKDAGDPWMQTALLSSVGKTAPQVLDRLMKDPNAFAALGAGHVTLLSRLSSVAGAAATEAELAAAMEALAAGDGTGAWRAAVLGGLADGLRRTNRPLAKLIAAPPPALKETAAKLAGLFKAAAAVAADEKAAPADRAGAVRLLGFGRFAEVAPNLQSLLSPQHPGEVQLAAVRALSGMDDAEVGGALLAGWPSYSPTVRREVIEALFARTDRLDALLTALEKGKVAPGQLEPARRMQLSRHPNEAVRKRAAALPAGASTNRKQVVEDFRPVLELKSDPAAGKLVFKKNCIGCHKLGGEGFEVGPDLAAALKTKTSEVLLVDILDPSREVDPRYLNYVVQTHDARIVSGMLSAETASGITLRRAERAEDTLLRSEIDLMKATTDSVMPEGLEKNINKQELADLIAYLMSMR